MNETDRKKALSKAAAILGSMTSARKKKSSKANGQLGGWHGYFKKEDKPAGKKSAVKKPKPETTLDT